MTGIVISPQIQRQISFSLSGISGFLYPLKVALQPLPMARRMYLPEWTLTDVLDERATDATRASLGRRANSAPMHPLFVLNVYLPEDNETVFLPTTFWLDVTE